MVIRMKYICCICILLLLVCTTGCGLKETASDNSAVVATQTERVETEKSEAGESIAQGHYESTSAFAGDEKNHTMSYTTNMTVTDANTGCITEPTTAVFSSANGIELPDDIW